MINLKDALISPSSVFSSPKDVLLNTELLREQKIEILKRWQSEIRVIEVAEDENMLGHNHLDILEEIYAALRTLGANIDTDHTPPTKEGG